jgi:hypothetical protein
VVCPFPQHKTHADLLAAVFKESWAAKKSRIRASSPWGHLANWNVGHIYGLPLRAS